MKAKKEKYTIWIKPSTMDAVKRVYKTDNCGTQSEFVEKAILFYLGYLSAEEQKTYLPNIVTSTLKGIVAESDNRHSRMLFKLAVEMAMMMNVVAYSCNVDKESLERLRGECMKEVKRTNGSFNMKDAVEWQRGEGYE